MKKLSPNAIEGEGFAGILNGRIRFEDLDREGNPTQVLRRTAGRVAFANSELHGQQNWLDATAEGRRTVQQLFG